MPSSWPTIQFGTDGWRVVITEEFMFSAVERLTQAAAVYFTRNPPPGTTPAIVVGYDTRFRSDAFTAAVVKVFTATGSQ